MKRLVITVAQLQEGYVGKNLEQNSHNDAAMLLQVARELADTIMRGDPAGTNLPESVTIEAFGRTATIEFVEADAKLEASRALLTTTGYHDNGPIVGAKLTVADVARICHEANRALCQCFGDDSQSSWENAPNFQRKSAVAGVLAILVGHVTTPEESHESWKAAKIADGWKYGPVNDPEKKEHPSIVDSYDELPVEQRVKDHVYFAIVKAIIAFGNPG